jgi:hypothetical protein
MEMPTKIGLYGLLTGARSSPIARVGCHRGPGRVWHRPGFAVSAVGSFGQGARPRLAVGLARYILG